MNEELIIELNKLRDNQREIMELLIKLSIDIEQMKQTNERMNKFLVSILS